MNKLNVRLNGRTDRLAISVAEAGGNGQPAGRSNSPLDSKSLQLVVARSEPNDLRSVLSIGQKNDDKNGERRDPRDTRNIIIMNECHVHRDSEPNAVDIPEQSVNSAASDPSLSNNLDHNLARNVKPNLINRNQITRLFSFEEPIYPLSICSALHTFPKARNLRHYLTVRLSCCLMIDQQLIKYLAIQASRTFATNRLNLDQDPAEI